MAVEKITCPKCGKRTSKASPFCLYCGVQLGEILLVDESENDFTSSNITQNNRETISEKVRTINQAQEIKNNEVTIPPQEENERIQESLEEEYEEELSENEIEDDELQDDEYEEELVDDEEAIQKIFQKETDQSSAKDRNNENHSLSTRKNKEMIKNASLKASEGVASAFKTLRDNTTQKEPKSQNEGNKKLERKISRDDINEDHYYDNIIAEVDARIEHIKKENVIKTIGMIASVLLVISVMVYFVIL